MIALLIAGCGALPGKDADSDSVDDLTVDGLDVSRGAVETVLQARWETAEPTRSDVTVRFGDDAIVVSEAEAVTSHDVVLVGIPADTQATVRVTVDGSDASAQVVALTGRLPAWVPDLTYTAEAPEQAAGGVTFAPVFLANGGGVVGIDGRGRVVWSWPPEEAPMVGPPFRARRSLDGQAVLFNNPAPDDETTGPIIRIPFSGDGGTAVDVLGSHTDFDEYAPGGYLALGWDIREIDGRRILGDTIRARAPDGTERLVWSVWDHFSPDLSRTYDPMYSADPTVEDWSHVNSLHYDPATDAIFVTTTFNNAALRVDRETGALAWTLADTEGDFANVDGTDRLALPHSAEPVAGGVLAFSRGNLGDPDDCSAAVELALDETVGTAREVWRREEPDCLLVPFLGAAQRLPGGNTQVTWSSAGRINEITPEGEVAWQVSTTIGAAFGFATRVTE